jgi:MoxR-like ATPase
MCCLLQDKCEPPVFVSDRRFMKAVQLLQVAAFSDGREEVCHQQCMSSGKGAHMLPACESRHVAAVTASQVNEYDCLILEHVFGSRPDDSVKVGWGASKAALWYSPWGSLQVLVDSFEYC